MFRQHSFKSLLLSIILTSVTPVGAQTVLPPKDLNAELKLKIAQSQGNNLIYVRKALTIQDQQALANIKKLSVRGPGGTGGGDEFVLDFISTALNEVYPMIDQHLSKEIPALKGDDFLNAVDPKIVISHPQVFENCDLENPHGREVDVCYNQYRDQFVVSRTRYPINKSSANKLKLVAHEIFRRMGLEGDDYDITKKVVVPSGFIANSDLLKPNKLITPSQHEVSTWNLELKNSSEAAQSSYAELANMMRRNALDSANSRMNSLNKVREMMAQWVEKQIEANTNKVGSKGIIEIDLGKMDPQNGNSSYSAAYAEAMNRSLSGTGIGVLSVGTKGNQAITFIGPENAAEMRIGEHAFKVMSYSQGLEAMGRVYTEALRQLEIDFKKDLIQKGANISMQEYMQQLNAIFESANLRISLVLFQDKAAQQDFLKKVQINLDGSTAP